MIGRTDIRNYQLPLLLKRDRVVQRYQSFVFLSIFHLDLLHSVSHEDVVSSCVPNSVLCDRLL
jgi:hypothetical protein